jgi:hypothetical protein
LTNCGSPNPERMVVTEKCAQEERGAQIIIVEKRLAYKKIEVHLQ